MNIPMQPMPIDYKLVQNPDAGTFQKEIKKLLEEGYTFHGPTTINGTNFVQPMVMLEVRPVKMGKLDGSDILPVPGILQR